MRMLNAVSNVVAAVALATSLVAAADTVTTTATTSVCPSACASDNCFRQLAGHTASASVFCHTFTTATTTAVTGFPTYLSASCGVSRASSVCSCFWPTAPTTSPPSTVTADGTATVVSTTTVVTCPSSLNLLSHGSNPCLSPWQSLDEIIENNVGDYTLQTVNPVGAPSTDGAWLVSPLLSFPYRTLYILTPCYKTAVKYPGTTRPTSKASPSTSSRIL
jgi:hypothetical protein